MYLPFETCGGFPQSGGKNNNNNFTEKKLWKKNWDILPKNSHLGGLPDHKPPWRHSLDKLPLALWPSLHLYDILEPK